MKKLKNKNIGAKVIVKEVLVEISAKVGWRRLKNVSGVIVKRGSHEQYFHSCTGGYTYIQKNVIEYDHLPTLAVKLDNGVIDIEEINEQYFKH